jgi:hypothetical protein
MIRLYHIVLNVTANTMLRPEQGRQIDLRMLMKDIRCISETGQYSRLIAHKAYPLAFQFIYLVFDQNLYARPDPGFIHNFLYFVFLDY